MALLDTLTGGFSEGGFSLDGALGGVGSQLASVDPAGPEIDTGSLDGIAGRLGEADPGAIGGALEGVLHPASQAGPRPRCHRQDLHAVGPLPPCRPETRRGSPEASDKSVRRTARG